MVKGKLRPDYNDFEEEMFYIAGYVGDKTGLDFFFEHVYQTFEIAEKAILEHSIEYKQSFDREDYDIRQSIYFHDRQHEISSNPLLTTLHNSNFVTLHSEFETIWDEIVDIHNRHFPIRKKISISNLYFTHSTFDPNCLLDKVLSNHKILGSYNLIRNKVIHGFCKTSSQEYQAVKNEIDCSVIKHIKTIEDGDKAYFQIENIKFCKQYGNAILSFIYDIGETAFNDRKHGS